MNLISIHKSLIRRCCIRCFRIVSLRYHIHITRCMDVCVRGSHTLILKKCNRRTRRTTDKEKIKLPIFGVWIMFFFLFLSFNTSRILCGTYNFLNRCVFKSNLKNYFHYFWEDYTLIKNAVSSTKDYFRPK